MLPPTQIFHPNPIPPHRSICYFDFHDKNFFTFLYSFTTTVQTSKQYSLVGPTIEVYISGIIIHAIFISAYLRVLNVYSQQYRVVCTNLSFSGGGKDGETDKKAFNELCYADPAQKS